MRESLKQTVGLLPLLLAAACRPEPDQIALTHLTALVDQAHDRCDLAVQTPAHLASTGDETTAKAVLYSHTPFTSSEDAPASFTNEQNCLVRLIDQSNSEEAGCDVNINRRTALLEESVVGFALEASTDCTAPTVRATKLAVAGDQE